MLPLTDRPEQSFRSLEELRGTIVSQDREVYEARMDRVSLTETGTLRAGRFEGGLTRTALRGVLRTEGIPEDFAMRCPPDLLGKMVERLAPNKSVMVHTVGGVATAVVPSDHQIMQYEMLIDRLGVGRPIREAILGPDYLRVVAANGEPKELLPSDPFSFGWELMASEDGWRPTELWRWAVREICTNGAVGFDKSTVFRVACNSRRPILKSLEDLVCAIDRCLEPPQLKTAMRWAADRAMGSQYENAVAYLSRRLGGESARLELADVTADTLWYEVLNRITSLAQLHSVEMRRRYELEGGILLNWFSRQGRGRPPWRRVSCEECEVRSAHSDTQDAGPGGTE
jgi:hypothetical protein